jgi:hypothetical protein
MDDIESLFDNDPTAKQQEIESQPSLGMIDSLFQNNDELCLQDQSESDQKLRAALLHSAEYGIRDSVKSQVEDVRWLKDVTRHMADSERGEEGGAGEEELVRCAVCTLPVGSCQHSSSWLDSSLTDHRHAAADDALQSEIDQVLGLLDTGGGGVQLDTRHQHGDIDLETIRWSQHTPRLADKIGEERTRGEERGGERAWWHLEHALSQLS